MNDKLRRVLSALPLSRRRDVLMFLLFLAISFILWSVLSLNQEEQADVRMPVQISHLPDSVTLLSHGPENMMVSLRTAGAQRLRIGLGKVPTLNIDFRAYRDGNRMFVSNAELKALVRSATGSTQAGLLYPDSISIPFTTHPGFWAPVSLIEIHVSAGPRSALAGRPRLSTDSVRVYTQSGRLPAHFTSVKTEAVTLEDLNQSTTRRVRLVGPAGSRLIPDSVDISFEVEPLILKTRTVVIEPVNVPRDIKLITFPAQVDVVYMVPMSAYTHTDPRFRVIADYRGIGRNSASTRMKLRLADVPANLENVHLSSDSAEYIIEHL